MLLEQSERSCSQTVPPAPWWRQLVQTTPEPLSTKWRNSLAGFEAIAVTSRAILGVIEDARLAEFERARFRLFQSMDMDSPREGFTEGISLYLYRVTFNTTRRNMPPRRADGRPCRSTCIFCLQLGQRTPGSSSVSSAGLSARSKTRRSCPPDS
jgi:hypothetical protein